MKSTSLRHRLGNLPLPAQNIPLEVAPVKHKILSPLNQAWTDLLNPLPWTFWCTFTTRFELSLASARRMAFKIAHYALTNEQQLMFWAAEEFDIRWGFHIHALVNSSRDIKKFWSWAFKAYGRAKIVPYDKRIGAGAYVSKYIHKNMTDYDFISGPKFELHQDDYYEHKQIYSAEEARYLCLTR